MKDLGSRLDGVANEAVLMTCESLEKAIVGGKSGENVAEHVGKIEELASALYTALNPERGPDDLKTELNKAITVIKSRGRRD
jgi:hypothetical protein